MAFATNSTLQDLTLWQTTIFRPILAFCSLKRAAGKRICW